MSENAIGAVWHNINVATASGLATLTAGAGTVLDILPALLGSVASSVGIVVTCWVGYHTVKRIILERQQLHLQNTVLIEKAAIRKMRRAKGEPTRREDD